MNFNVYFDEATGRKLERLARRRRVSRNALIREAVQDLVERAQQTEGWSRDVLEWEGDAAFPPFESHRRRLRPASDDPLA